MVILIVLFASLFYKIPQANATTPVLYANCSGHPVNSAGAVTDGTPQCSDIFCVGTTAQQVACLIARRPGCVGWKSAMPRQTAWNCWAAEANVYPWDPTGMTDALFCESKGTSGARNGRYVGLFQSDSGNGDPVHDFENAYWVKWKGQGPSAWRGSYDHYCAN